MYEARHQACSITRNFGGNYELTIIPIFPVGAALLASSAVRRLRHNAG